MSSVLGNSFFMIWLQEQNMPLPCQNSPKKLQSQSQHLEINTSSDQSSPKKSVPDQLECQELEHDIQVYQQSKQTRKCSIYSRQEKDPDFNLKKQKKNRNVLSNLVHHLLKYFHNRVQTQQYIQQVIDLNEFSINADQFYCLLQNLNKILKSYVTEKSLMDLWLGQLSIPNCSQKSTMREFGKILRIISRKFYRETCRSSIFFSNKLSIESKNLHYEGLREIYDLLVNLKEGHKKEKKRGMKKRGKA